MHSAWQGNRSGISTVSCSLWCAESRHRENRNPDLYNLITASGCTPDTQVINGTHKVLAAIFIIQGAVSGADSSCRTGHRYHAMIKIHARLSSQTKLPV